MQQLRDIEKYTKDYLSNEYDFEKIQVKYLPDMGSEIYANCRLK